MLSWGAIAYGAALSAVLAVILVLAARERDPVGLILVAVGAFAAPVAWNAILRATHADQFFTDAPIVVFPISWQDTGSGVVTFALLSVLLGLGPHRTAHARRVVGLAASRHWPRSWSTSTSTEHLRHDNLRGFRAWASR